ESIDMARPAVSEDVDDAFRLGRKVRRPRGERPRRVDRRGGEQAGVAKQPAEREPAEAEAAAGEEVAAGGGGAGRAFKGFTTRQEKPGSTSSPVIVPSSQRTRPSPGLR